MGIPGFYGSWLRRLIEKSLIRGDGAEVKADCEGLSVDANGLFHEIAGDVWGYNPQRDIPDDVTDDTLFEEFKEKLGLRIVDMLKTYKPKQYFFFCVDGVAPFAKIYQQRTRRFRLTERQEERLNIIGDVENSLKAFNTVNTCEDEESRQIASEELRAIMQRIGSNLTEEEAISIYYDTQRFDTSNITPSTPFMILVDQYLTELFLWLQGQPFSPPFVHYSSHEVSGEGEHKIFNLIRDRSKIRDITQGKGYHVIDGMDSDLLMLTSLSPVKRMIMVKDNFDFKTGVKDKHYIPIDSFIHLMKLNGLIHTNRVNQIAPYTPGRSEWVQFTNLSNNQKARLYTEFSITPEEYVPIFYPIGNDFLPHIPSLSDIKGSIETLILCYRRMDGLPITRQKTSTLRSLNWRGMKEWLRLLSLEEERLLISRAGYETGQYFGKDSKPLSCLHESMGPGSTIDYEGFRAKWYSKWVVASSEEDFEQQISLISFEYLSMFEWVYAYYQGVIASHYLCYQHPYSPLLSDLYRASLTIEDDSSISIYGSDEKEIKPIHQLLSNIPQRSIELIPEEYRRLLNINPSVSSIKLQRSGSQVQSLEPGPESENTVGYGYLADICPHRYRIDRDGAKKDYMSVVILPEVSIKRVMKIVSLVEKKFGKIKYSNNFVEYRIDKSTQVKVVEQKYAPQKATVKAKRMVNVKRPIYTEELIPATRG
jgi:5'-3' exonuclease